MQNKHNGVIIINKPKGFTSHDVVSKLRGILSMKKIGHTGTLDPDAVGVLPVCVGNATKISDLLTSYQKEYEAEVTLGAETDTQDSSGNIVRTSDVNVKVHGTRFNVSEYNDDDNVNVTLCRGAVNVKTNKSDAEPFRKKIFRLP